MARTTFPELIALLFLFTALNLEAEVWVGMKKGELLKELGAPQSSLTAGPKELHRYSDGRRVEILNDRVTELIGFPPDSIIEVKKPIDLNTAKASTAYADATPAVKKSSEFVDFNTLKATKPEDFTLSSSHKELEPANRVEKLLGTNKATTLYVLGGGIIGCIFAGFLISVARWRKAVNQNEKRTEVADHELPPFLNSTPIEKPTIQDPRGETSKRREERLAQRDNPDTLGLSIRASPYQDFDPTIPKVPLVSSLNSAGANPAYNTEADSATNTVDNEKAPNANPIGHDSAIKKKSSLKLNTN